MKMFRTITMIKGDSRIVCNNQQVEHFAGLGFKEQIENKHIDIESTNRQRIITEAINVISIRKSPDDFTTGGFIKLSAVKKESGLDDITIQEKSTIMKNIEADSV